MNYAEYGKRHREAIVLLHGGGLSWWNYREAAENLSSNFHVILPILDGHAKSGYDFTSIEGNAARIIQLIDARFGGSVLLMGGLSLGGQILLEILSQRKNICQYAVIESALSAPSKWTRALINPLLQSCFGLIRQPWFARLQFKSLGIKQELFEDYYKDTCSISKSNLIAILEANTMYAVKKAAAGGCAKAYVFAGGSESAVMKKSAEIIHQALPGSVVEILPGLHHGAFSINHADDYANTVRRIIMHG